MAAFLKTLLGNGTTQDIRPEELQSIVSEIQRERVAFEGLLEQARGSAAEIRQLSAPIAEARRDVASVAERIGALENQMGAFEKILPEFETLRSQADVLVKTQRRTEAQVSHASADVERVRAEMEGLTHTVDTALLLKDDIAEFLALDGPFKDLKGQADDLAGELEQYRDSFSRMRDQQDEVTRTQRDASSRLEAFDHEYRRLSGDLEDTGGQVSELRQTLDRLGHLASGITDTKRELGTLKALADYVTRKTVALEQQREAVDRATTQAANLQALMRQIDVGLQKQKENSRALGEMEVRVDELRSLHDKVLERSEEIAEHQTRVDQEERATREQLETLRDEAQKSVERFDLEHRGLDAVSQRIVDLRGALADFEQRFDGLSESNQVIAETHARAQGLAGQVNSISSDIEQLIEQADRARTVKSDLARLDEVVQEVNHRVSFIEEAQPAIDAMLRDFASLGRSHEAVKDAMEQVRVAHAEMTRVRQGQAETEDWLGGVEASLATLQSRVKELNALKPTVEGVRKEVERVTSSMTTIESRREFVDQIHQRLAELSSLSAQLDERGKGLQVRMEAAEGRFVTLAQHADEAEQVATRVTSVTASVQDAEDRIAQVGDGVASLEGRAQNLETMSERMRRLGQELEQRQGALEQATQHLERASSLRQEAADAAQQLQEQTRQLAGALSVAEKRGEQLDQLSESLEDRSSNLRFVEKRLGQFEERFAKWELAEQEVGRALEQVATRQATIDMLQADIKRMFEMTERTVDDVRSIAKAQQEIRETRSLLDDVLGRVQAVDGAVEDLDARRQQIEHAEERLTRVDALLIDVQSSLETLAGQKALVDHVVEKSGSLTFQLKQAEALIDTLRDEREMTNRVRAAYAEVRQPTVTAKAG